MKILAISSCYPSEEHSQYCVFIKQQLDELRNMGNRIDVLVPQKGIAENQIIYQRDKIENRYIMPELSHTNLIDAISEFDTESKRCGSLIENFARNNGYEIIVVHITSDVYLAAAVYAGKRLRIPVIQHYHGLNVWKNYIEPHPYIAKFNALRRRAILKKCDAIIGVSEKVTNIIKEKIHDVPVYTVYNGVDLTRFRYSMHCCDPLKSLKMITVANLIPIKGINYLIDAFAKVKQMYPTATLEVIGNGYLMGDLKKQCEDLGVRESVFFAGTQPYDEVAKRMEQSDLFVLPSFYEAIGCVYLEAMGCGLPTIGTAGMGIDEVIEHKKNGLLVKERNSDSVYEAIMQLVQNPDLFQEISMAGHRTAESFTWKKSAEDAQGVYEMAIRRKL